MVRATSGRSAPRVNISKPQRQRHIRRHRGRARRGGAVHGGPHRRPGIPIAERQVRRQRHAHPGSSSDPAARAGLFLRGQRRSGIRRPVRRRSSAGSPPWRRARRARRDSPAAPARHARCGRRGARPRREAPPASPPVGRRDTVQATWCRRRGVVRDPPGQLVEVESSLRAGCACPESATTPAAAVRRAGAPRSASRWRRRQIRSGIGDSGDAVGGQPRAELGQAASRRGRPRPPRCHALRNLPSR